MVLTWEFNDENAQKKKENWMLESEFRVTIDVNDEGVFKVKVNHDAKNKSTSKIGGEKYYNALISQMEKSLNVALEGLNLNKMLFNSQLKTSRVNFMSLGSESMTIGFNPSEKNVEDFVAIMNTPRQEE